MTRREFDVAGLPEPISHYADAVQAGEFLFISGMPPLDAAGTLVGPGDVEAQFAQVLSNLDGALRAAGGSPADVVKVMVYLTDVDDRPRINPQRIAYFGEARPASTLVEVPRLAIPGMVVEMEAVAYLPGPRGAERPEGSAS
jgi:2-iminobutanoate/2-iminopropanoate deaminase